MNQLFKRSSLALAVLIGINIIILPSISSAATKVDLGASSSFGVLAATSVTNTNATVITGTAGSMVGVTPGTSVTGQSTLTSGAVVTGNTAPAPAAMSAAQAAYTSGRNQTPTVAIPQADLGGLTLTPGAYTVETATATLTGNLTLNGGGNPNAVFIFDTSAAFTTASASTVTLTNGTQACNVFWLIGSAATLGSGSSFAGHLIANTGVFATSGAKIAGSLTSLTANVTLDNNTITNNNCAAAVVPAPTPTPVTAPVEPTQVDSVNPASCATSGPTAVTLNGSFPTAVTSVTVNGKAISKSDFVQTASSLVVTSPVTTNDAVMIELFNGTVPLLAVQTFVCEPTSAVSPIVPVVVPSVTTITIATIHVVKVVNNTYGGTATPGDFMISLRHHGIDVVGSPAPGVDGAGRTYFVAPGTYVVGEPDSVTFPNYIDLFKINGQDTQDIVLAPGDSITVTQTNTQLPPLNVVAAAPASNTPAPVTPPKHTVKGGKLPKTSSPWFNLLLFGVGGMVIGGALLGRKRRPQN